MLEAQNRGAGSRIGDPRKRPVVISGLHAYKAVINSGRLVPALRALGCRLRFADFGEKDGDK